jgi:hypothetical protein
MYLYSIRRCGNEVFTHRAGRMSIEATILLSLLCLFWVLSFFYLFYLQIWCWTEIREKEKKRCELSVFLLYLFIHVHYLFSMRMHLFKSIYAQSNKHDHYTCTLYVSKLPYLFRLVASLDINIHILWSCSIDLFFSFSLIDLMSFKVGIINDKSFNLYFLNELFD